MGQKAVSWMIENSHAKNRSDAVYLGLFFFFFVVCLFIYLFIYLLYYMVVYLFCSVLFVCLMKEGSLLFPFSAFSRPFTFSLILSYPFL